MKSTRVVSYLTLFVVGVACQQAPADGAATSVQPSKVETVLPAGTMTAELMVEGVGCASCELPLRRSLGKLVGVVRIREGSTKQHLLVDFIPQQLAADRIVDAVYEAGYSAEVLVRATES